MSKIKKKLSNVFFISSLKLSCYIKLIILNLFKLILRNCQQASCSLLLLNVIHKNQQREPILSKLKIFLIFNWPSHSDHLWMLDIEGFRNEIARFRRRWRILRTSGRKQCRTRPSWSLHRSNDGKYKHCERWMTILSLGVNQNES